MKTAVYTTLAVAAAAAVSHVSAHGQMTEPAFRPITARYRQDALWGLKGAGDDELQWAPLENLSKRGQSDQPPAPTFDIMNGCRGLVYEAGNPVTELTAGVAFPVKYYVQAPHPGFMELYVVKPAADTSGKVAYKQVAQLKRIDDFATTGGNGETIATIPSSVKGCSNAGDCALQFFWHSDVADQTYVTCADIVVKDSGASGPTAPTTKNPAPGGSSTPVPAKKKCKAKARRSRK